MRTFSHWAVQNPIRYNCVLDCERGPPMPTPSLQAKKAYYAKARQSNYVASLRLEGFDVSPADAERKLPSREAVLGAYRARQD
ncbi:hypothetical protein D3C84_648870 [compost metagenome]